MDILVADDHGLVRDGLKPFLRELDSGVSIHEAATLDEALAKAAACASLGLIVLDLNMPGMDGLAGLERLHALYPETPIVILSGHVSRADVMAAVRAGAVGYIPKTVGGSSMVNALRLVLSGETYVPAMVFTEPETVQPQQVPLGAQPLATLSPREREILEHLVSGSTNKEIARKLELQEITIKIHLRNVYRKIGAVNRAQAVRIALSGGLLAAEA